MGMMTPQIQLLNRARRRKLIAFLYWLHLRELIESVVLEEPRRFYWVGE